jgi:hypothetical protein
MADEHSLDKCPCPPQFVHHTLVLWLVALGRLSLALASCTDSSLNFCCKSIISLVLLSSGTAFIANS